MLDVLGRRIRDLRKERGWSQRELCARAELSARFLVQLEGGQGNVSLLRLADICRALDVSLVSLLAGLGPVEDTTHRIICRMMQVSDQIRSDVENLLVFKI